MDTALRTAVLPHWHTTVDQTSGGYIVEYGEKSTTDVGQAQHIQCAFLHICQGFYDLCNFFMEIQ